MPRYYLVREDDSNGCGCLLLLLLVVIAFGVYHTSSTSHTTSSSSNTPSASMAQAAVQQYYAAINSHHYRTAYNTWQANAAGTGQPYAQFVAGYGNTVRDDITFDSVAPQDDTTVNVNITIHAKERNRTETFSASYVVGAVGDSWKIMSGSIQKTG